MEALSDMRHILFPMMAVGTICLATACKQELDPVTPQESVRTITVHAKHADTRTSVYFNTDVNKYKSAWDNDDKISLFELSGDDCLVGISNYCAPYEETDAYFEVDFDDEPLSSSLQYIGAYPKGNAEVFWSDDFEDVWAEVWGEVPTTPRWGLAGIIPKEQSPAPYCFEAEADLLFSRMSESFEDRPADLTLSFARVGSIAKISLTGLPAGKRLWSGTFSHGNSWQSTGCVFFDPEAGKVAIMPSDEDDGTCIEFNADKSDFLIGNDETVVIWLRVLSGSLTDHFTITVEIADEYEDNPQTFEKVVDMNGGTLRFTEGNITEFSVAMQEKVAETIVFQDATVEALCVRYFDENEDGYLDTIEASRVKTLNVVEPGPSPKSRVNNGLLSPFKGNSNITSFNELQYFTGLKSIEAEAFAECSGLTSITIPNSVTTIESEAFSGAGLVSITIPDSVTTIEEGAFEGCSALTSFRGKYAYKEGKYLICKGTLIAVALPDLSGEYTIPSDLGITGIGACVFEGRTGLTAVTIPSGVISIGCAAFDGCTGLIRVSLPETVRILDYLAFCWCSSLKNINLPYGLEVIGTNAFQSCNSLESIEIPGSVTSLGQLAFGSCEGLTSVTLDEGMKRTGASAFRYCTSLTSVSFPSGLETVSSESFQYCTALSSVTIPASVTLLDAFAFQYCSELKEVTLLPTTPPSMGNNVFYGTHSELTIYVPTGTKSAYVAKQEWKPFADKIKEKSL